MNIHQELFTFLKKGTGKGRGGEREALHALLLPPVQQKGGSELPSAGASHRQAVVAAAAGPQLLGRAWQGGEKEQPRVCAGCAKSQLLRYRKWVGISFFLCFFFFFFFLFETRSLCTSG